MDFSSFLFGDGDDHHHHHHHHHYQQLHQQLQLPQSSPKKEVQLQGPRPTPLRVSKDSHSIRKPPRHPLPAAPFKHPPPPTDDPPHPVIIYAISPKVIHVEESDFMSLVQRLTGLSPSGPRTGDVSPAARFASIERTSPKHRPIMGLDGVVGGDRGTTTSITMADDGFDLAATGRGSLPGILSPAPSSLPGIPSGLFSPVKDSLGGVPLFHDLAMSPLLQGGGGGTGAGFFGGGGIGSILSSPSSTSSWFSSFLISPSPTSLDLYNLLADF